ncbi:hypothetical protein RJ639_026999 [Escallonia herrerae]|uniref:HSF-type DNA-binding domain-containing protein n=1 Tax=Escallonia herrerae TaxID=1293975 RepID=A0AA89BG55_9ASTE|nr:hypothetical protein RJ639_026999 [Escallonia herrerae]
MTNQGDEGGVGVGGGGGGDGSSSSSMLNLPPIKALRDSGPPPFLRKTYDMVDDPNLDSIISWSPSRTSFIVWNPHMFSAEVLPKYFKHNNFRNFITQLLNYGFYKISWDRHEYGNEWFQGGKKHWLMKIKRKQKDQSQVRQQRGTKRKPGIEDQLEKLRNEQYLMKVAIQKLDQKQMNINNDLATFKEQTQKTVSTMAGTFIPSFIKRLCQQLKHEKCLDKDEKAKTQKLVEPESDGQAPLEPRVEPDSSANELVSNPVQEQNGDSSLLKKMLMEEEGVGYEPEGELAKHHSKIFMELEDLIAAPPDWSQYMKELKEEAAGRCELQKQDSNLMVSIHDLLHFLNLVEPSLQNVLISFSYVPEKENTFPK